MGLHVNIDNFAEQYPDVSLPVEHVSKRRCNLPRRERACCDLIEQRLEKMEVPAVDQSNIDGGVLEGTGGVESAESAADDHHTRPHDFTLSVVQIGDLRRIANPPCGWLANVQTDCQSTLGSGPPPANRRYRRAPRTYPASGRDAIRSPDRASGRHAGSARWLRGGPCRSSRNRMKRSGG